MLVHFNNDPSYNSQGTFFKKSTEDGICKRMIILFTDGKIDFDVDTVKNTLEKMDVRLLVLDFSSPLSPRTNRQVSLTDVIKRECDVTSTLF